MRACHYLTNQPPFTKPSRGLREGFAEPPRRLHEPFAEVAYTEGSTKTPWRVHETPSKGPWMNCMFLLDDACNRVWSILYCFFTPYATNIGEPVLIPWTVSCCCSHHCSHDLNDLVFFLLLSGCSQGSHFYGVLDLSDYFSPRIILPTLWVSTADSSAFFVVSTAVVLYY